MRQSLKYILQFIAAYLIMWLASVLSIGFNDLMLPISFQSMTAILLPLVFDKRIGALAVLANLISGALGLPVFAEGSGGYIYFLANSGGYLVGFLVAAVLAMPLKQFIKGRMSFLIAILIFIGLQIAITLCGLSWLIINDVDIVYGRDVSPYMPGLIIKSLIGASIVLAVKHFPDFRKPADEI